MRTVREGKFGTHEGKFGENLRSLMDGDTERVTVASVGDGSFDPYRMNLNLLHMTTIINTNESPLVVDEQGGQGTEEVIVVKDENAETNPVATPSTEETQGAEERSHDGEVPK